ncbi:putative negative regulator of RcsB-dependent stress response [Azonexus fungiphilus]|uniref:Ancillary SecYEG translocon subunit n=1 Tax=Azonexus fungiphilus TaxID=146940 RepID=A0A495WBP8_9RHOO|nr:tetratricopeptide repeat protein [Azonexus fungiphilus]RKT58163.1 putative negative regulator of RcsB-dependent stress response [Azonexus fungiphilus]
MAHYDLEEQEQIDSLKTWWKMYGNLVTSLVTAAALAVVGWQGWNWYQNNETAKAAAVFAALEQAVQAGDTQRIKAGAGELTEKFGRSGYAGLGALLAAKHSVDGGDLKTAKAQLGWVADNAKDELRDIARLRLGAVLLDEQAYDEALKQLEATPAPAFVARFLELKGDVLSAQGKVAEARTAYQSALDKATGDAAKPGRELLQQKLDSLGDAA